MTTAIAPNTAVGSGIFRAGAILGLALAIAALLLLAAAPLGWRIGWWNTRFALGTLMPYAFYCGVASIGVSVLALAASLWRRVPRDMILAALGLAIGAGVSYAPLHWYNQRATYPRVNDVTTDFADPPSLAFAEAMRKAEQGNPIAYAGAEPRAVQQKSYPDVVPAMLDAPPGQAFDRVLALVKTKGWTVVSADPAAGVIDAFDRSFWFGFTDDIAIRVSPSERGSRVDIRSGARQGRGDFGVNAARVRGFLAALKGGG